MDTEDRDPLVAEIEQFLAESRITATAFGRDALSDPGFVFGLRSGRDCRLSTAERVREQMRHYREHGEFKQRAADASEQAAD
jgi:2,4-dienoyl-CoA reductase-like NADH-dependent reductase (Old Yellow Enzyme family)